MFGERGEFFPRRNFLPIIAVVVGIVSFHSVVKVIMVQRSTLFVPVFAIVLCLLLSGCPQHLVQQVERVLPPKDYKPIYLAKPTTFAAFLDSMRTSADSLGIERVRGMVFDMEESGLLPSSSGGTKPAQLFDSLSVSPLDTTSTPASDGKSVGTPRSQTGATGVAGSRPAAPSTATPTAEGMPLRPPLLMHIRSVDDSKYPEQVEMRAYVYDTTGKFIAGLAPPHFSGTGSYRRYWHSLVDACGGQSVPIDSFTVTEIRESDREPHAIAFVLDHSPSMGEQRALKLQEAVRWTLGIVKPGDYVSVIKFTKDIHVEVPLTGDSATYKKQFRVDGLEGYGGGTAMYDAALAGIEQVSSAPATCQRAIIVFSDGGDNSSQRELRQIYSEARKHQVAVYTIAYGLAEEEQLRELASWGGGKMYRVYSSKEFPYVFADIYRSLKNYYRIVYKPPVCAGKHTATVDVRLPELGDITLRARGHYDKSLFTPFDTVGSVVFANIEFEYGKAVVRDSSKQFIRDVAEAMRTRPTMRVEIRGHTDDVGSEEYNVQLSQARAQAVADELVKLGIAANRVVVVGYGESRPLVPNTSPENARKNRRTEFVILAQ